jgi:hypothetical protein
LNFTEDIPVLDIDEDIVCALLEAVDDPNEMHVAVLFAVFDDFVVEFDYLLLLRGTFAAD